MRQSISAIITVRGVESKLHQTIENLRENIGLSCEIIVVYDGTPPDESIAADQILYHKRARGVGPSRHRGILAAKYKIVFMCDAHMNFQPDFGKVIAAHFRKKENGSDLICGHCRPSLEDLSPIADSYTAARFGLKSKEGGGETWCLSAKWAVQELGEIGCVMGACYALRVPWYKETGEPLNLLRGWWGDEEYLSASTWLAGGKVILLPFWVSHLFRDKPSFRWSREDTMLPTVNRVRLVELLPCNDEMKEDLTAWLLLNYKIGDADYERIKAEDDKRDEVQEAKKLWATWAHRSDDFFSRWVDDEVKPLEERQEDRKKKRPWKNATITSAGISIPISRVQKRSYIVCSNCGMRNTFKVKRTVKKKGIKYRYGKCSNYPACSNNGVMIDRPEGQIVYWGKHADCF